jgi:hypothetical protein
MQPDELETETMRSIWQIVNPIQPPDRETCIKAAERLLLMDDEHLISLPLTKIFEDPSELTISLMRIATVKNWRGLLLPQQFVGLTCYLFKSKSIPLNEAIRLLTTINMHEQEHLKVESVEVVRTAAHVAEDADEGFLEVDEDDVFSKSVDKFLKYWRLNM